MEFIEGTLTLLSHLLLRGQDKSFSNLYAETCPGTGKGQQRLEKGGVKWCRAQGKVAETLYMWRVEDILEKEH